MKNSALLINGENIDLSERVQSATTADTSRKTLRHATAATTLPQGLGNFVARSQPRNEGSID